MNEREKYNRKIKLYERLGALKFQKVVFAVERGKFKLLKKICPNFIKHFDKYCDRKRRKEIKKANTPEEVKAISKKYKKIKLAARKEFYQEQNRNYHLDSNNPQETYEFLKWNKSIHTRNLKINALLIAALSTLVLIVPVVAIPLLALEVVSAGINFECVNIQNYNMCRYKRAEKALLRRAERRMDTRIKKYGDAAKVIHSSIEKSDDLPTFDEIISNIENIEQLRQIRSLLVSEIKERESKNSINKIGGKC